MVSSSLSVPRSQRGSMACPTRLKKGTGLRQKSLTHAPTTLTQYRVRVTTRTGSVVASIDSA